MTRSTAAPLSSPLPLTLLSHPRLRGPNQANTHLFDFLGTISMNVEHQEWGGPRQPQAGRQYFMAADLAQIEQRLTSVEAALAQLQQKLALAPSSTNWVEQISGSLADIPDEDYQHFLDYCRAVRNGDCPSPAPEARP
jgi:hypothetical protein